MALPRTVVPSLSRAVNRALRVGGLELRRVPTSRATSAADSTAPSPELPATIEPWSTDPLHEASSLQTVFAADAGDIVHRHELQSSEDIAALNERYDRPTFGRLRVWDLVERLGCCIDPSDQRLYGASQQMHVLQMLSEMEADGTATPEMVLVTLLHDLGKLLLLTDEDPANIVCMNGPVGEWPPGTGLENCLLQWNHDEFAYQRLKDHISEDAAWLIRYHSVDIEAVRPLMDDTDRERTERLLRPFAHYDHATKTPFRLPAVSLTHYRDILEEAFPHPIAF